MRHTWFFVIMVVVAACGDDSSPVTFPDVNQDLGQHDVGSHDMPADFSVPGDMCNITEDIGLIADGLSLTVDLDAPGPNDLARCVVPAVESGARVLRFHVAKASRLTLTADPIPKLVGEVVVPPQPAIEIRTNDCVPTSAGECSRLRSTNFSLEADVDYFMLINAEKDSGGVRLKFELEDSVCTSAQNGCTDGVIAKCSEDGSKLTESKCVDTCDTDGCLGNTCDSATDIIVAASGTTTITGNRSAYTNSWSAENRAGCNLRDGEEPGPTTGPDLVIRIPDVPKNSTVTLSAENDLSEGVYGFFVVESCAAVGCLKAGSFDDNSNNQLTFRASTAGDVLVRVEALGEMDSFFAIDVSVAP